MTPSHRLQAALQSQSQSQPPARAVAALARALRDEGMPQVALYRLYLAAHVRSDLAEPQRDALADAMDLIWGGGWAKGHALFAQTLTQERLDRE